MPTLTRYRHTPFEMMTRLGEEFDELFRRPGSAIFGNAELYTPLDLQEDDKELVLKMDLPGFKESELKIRCDHNRCTVSGERKAESEETKGNYVMRERHYGKFQRTLELPADVKTEDVRARYREGVLEVHFPKAQKSSTKEIKIEAAP